MPKREDIKKIKHNWSEHFININDKILFALSDTSRPNCKLELKIVRQWDDKYEGAQFYGKSLIIKGDAKETVVNVGKGLNFYTDYSGYNKINRAYEKKPLKLKKENAYTLELVRSDKRPRFTTPTRFTPIDANSSSMLTS